MNKITRTFKKCGVSVSIYMFDSKTLEVINDYVFETINTKKAKYYFDKKYEKIGKVVDIDFTGNNEMIKAEMDVNTFLSLATIKVI